jgi:ABC-type amino acid transport substrate-binding protein
MILAGLILSACGADAAAENTAVSEVESAPVEEDNTKESAPPESDSAETEDSVEIEAVRVRVQSNSLAPLALFDGETYSGFAIDLASEIVARVYGSQTPIGFVPITSQERFSALADGQIAMLVRNLVHTGARESEALFSGAYLLSGNGFLVFNNSGISSIADLDGKNIAIPSFMEGSLEELANVYAISLNSVVADNIENAILAIEYGDAEATFHDWVALAGSLNNSIHTLLLDDSNFSPIAVALPLGSEELRDEVDAALAELIADGTWQNLFTSWFGIDVPWNMDEMFGYPAGN